MAQRTMAPADARAFAERSVPSTGDVVIFHAPDSTQIAARVQRVRGNRLRIDELIRGNNAGRTNLFATYRWIGVNDVDAFDRQSKTPVRIERVARPVASTIAPTSAEQSAVRVANMNAGLTSDGYVKYTCDRCGRVSHRRPNRTQTTCRPCSKSA